MGNLSHTVSGTDNLVSFKSAARVPIESLKCHFAPIQDGEGDPSPENVRPIRGWDGITVYKAKKNIGHIIGFSASANAIQSRVYTNNYGTTIDTIDFNGPNGAVSITQSQAPESSNITHYRNGYIDFYPDNLIFGHKYNISFKVSNIISNPLNTVINNFRIITPNGNQSYPSKIVDNTVYYNNFTYIQRSDRPEITCIDIRICGMSCTISDFMITSASIENDGIWEPYAQTKLVNWNQWLKPLTAENWQAYNDTKIDVEFNNGIATSTWLTDDTIGYSSSIRTKVGTLQKNKEMWYVSYMLKSSVAGKTWGVEYNGGLQNTTLTNAPADTWIQSSDCSLYWRDSRNYTYISYCRTYGNILGMVVQTRAPILINLTQMFGYGNEPTKEEFEAQCILNGIDLTKELPYNEGTTLEWKTNGELLKQEITFPILGKNKFNINSTYTEPTNTSSASSTKRIFDPYTYCLGMSAGNNYLPDRISNYSISNNSLTFTSSNTSYGIAFFIPSLYGTYKLSYTGENANATIVCYDKNGNMIYDRSSIDFNNIFTIGKSVAITGIIFRPTTANTPTTVSNIQVEEGITATEYEEFNPNHTVYGGYVDFAKGEIVAEYELLNKKWKNFTLRSSKDDLTIKYTKFTNPIYGSGQNAYIKKWCNVCPHSWTDVENRTPHFYTGYSTGRQRYEAQVFLPSNFDEEAEVQILANLITPIHYPLSKTNLTAFLGQNNFWSNTNDITEVSYAIHDSAPIRAAKHRIAVAEPHVETLTAAPLQNFVTDIKAPLKECRVHFEPKQDLHGYDKPWVGGSGKNLFNINATEQNPDDTTATNTTARNFTAGTYCVGTSWSNWLQPNQVLEYSVSNSVLSIKNNNVYGIGYALKVEPETNYAISATSSGGGIHAAFYDASGNFINGLSTNLLNTSFTTPADATITVLTFYNRSEGSDATAATFSNIQFEKSASITSYEPWKNICPISGWNEINIYKAGKNLLDISSPKSAINNGEVWYGIKAVTPASERVPDNSIYLPSGTYCFSLNDSVHCNELLMQDDNNNKFIHKYNVRSAQGTIDYGAYCYLYASASRTNIPDISKAQFYLEYGNTDTGYEPYNGTTIPISFPSVINMLSSTIITANKTLSSAGEEVSESGMSLTNYIKVNEDDTYKLTFTSKEGARTRRIYGYDANKDPVESLASTSWVTVDTTGTIQATIPSGVQYIRVCYKTADEDIFLEGPKSSVIYGGYVDLIKGELVQEWYTISIDETAPMRNYQADNRSYGTHCNASYWLSTFNGPNASGYTPYSTDGYCDKLYYYENNYANNTRVNASNSTVDISLEGVRSQEDFLAWLAENGPITICYRLKDPIHYTLSSTALKSLRGTNNIWSNANGNIELSYWKH